MHHLRSRVLIEENIEELVNLVNEELLSTEGGLRQRLKALDLELQDVQCRLGRLYESLETGALGIDDFAPRLKDLRGRQKQIQAGKVRAGMDVTARGVHQIDGSLVTAYAQDLNGLLQTADMDESKGCHTCAGGAYRCGKR